MGIPAWDNVTNPPEPMRKGAWVHYVASDTEPHKLVVITEVVNKAAGEVILQIDDAASKHGRYTTPATYDEQLSVGSWHWIEQ